MSENNIIIIIIVLKDLNRHFSVLKKYMNKFDCLEDKMLLIRKLTLSMSTSETISGILHI